MEGFWGRLLLFREGSENSNLLDSPATNLLLLLCNSIGSSFPRPVMASNGTPNEVVAPANGALVQGEVLGVEEGLIGGLWEAIGIWGRLPTLGWSGEGEDPGGGGVWEIPWWWWTGPGEEGGRDDGGSGARDGFRVGLDKRGEEEFGYWVARVKLGRREEVVDFCGGGGPVLGGGNDIDVEGGGRLLDLGLGLVEGWNLGLVVKLEPTWINDVEDGKVSGPASWVGGLGGDKDGGSGEAVEESMLSSGKIVFSASRRVCTPARLGE